MPIRLPRIPLPNISPDGLCVCGCGEKTTIAKASNRYYGYVRGQPIRYVFNHHPRQPRGADIHEVIDGEPCVLVALTQGQHAIINASDYPKIIKLRWFAALFGAGNKFYAYARRNGKSVAMHRLLCGEPEGMLVDHANGNGVDNRRKNLRVCNHSDNGRNRSGMGKITRFKCVRWNSTKKKWTAALHLGSFDSAEDAARAFDKAQSILFGEFGRPNFTEES